MTEERLLKAIEKLWLNGGTADTIIMNPMTADGLFPREQTQIIVQRWGNAYGTFEIKRDIDIGADVAFIVSSVDFTKT